jgi:hypothetical protein
MAANSMLAFFVYRNLSPYLENHIRYKIQSTDKKILTIRSHDSLELNKLFFAEINLTEPEVKIIKTRDNWKLIITKGTCSDSYPTEETKIFIIVVGLMKFSLLNS